MGALIPVFITALPYLVKAAQDIPQLVTFLANVHNIFKRTAPWTAEQEDAFEKEIEVLRNDPDFKVID